jgi:hypothetical protein
MSREELIAFIKACDKFYETMDFTQHTLSELKEIKARIMDTLIRSRTKSTTASG